MGQRLSRAKTKIADAGIAYAVPPPEQWDERHAGGADHGLSHLHHRLHRRARRSRATCVARRCSWRGCCWRLCPGTARDRRRPRPDAADRRPPAARIDAEGATVPPAEQDRQPLGCREAGSRRPAAARNGLATPRAGPFQVKAAISACQMAEPGSRLAADPAAVHRAADHGADAGRAVNHAVALAETGHLAARWPRWTACATRWPTSSPSMRRMRPCWRRRGRWTPPGARMPRRLRSPRMRATGGFWRGGLRGWGLQGPPAAP
jgi:hypothetical protein